MFSSSTLNRLTQDAGRFSLSLAQVKELSQKAVEAKSMAYSLGLNDGGIDAYDFLGAGKFSNFQVGACLLTESGRLVTGCNVENASFPVGICAERCAMAKAVSEGDTKFLAVAVATNVLPPCSPCGMCRQFMREFCSLGMPIFMYGPEDENERMGAQDYAVMTMGELLPMSFGPESMNPVRRTMEAPEKAKIGP